MPPSIQHEAGMPLSLAAPGAREIVVVVNNNIKMVHAGMFVGTHLLDPAGSYLAVRSESKQWSGPSLADYVMFQLEDGDAVSIYRFALAAEDMRAIEARVAAASGTLPLFCAAKVQNILSGIAPFESVPTTWLTSPARLAAHLDRLVQAQVRAGSCAWADGSACYRMASQATKEMQDEMQIGQVQALRAPLSRRD
jgi:hypothetical protein